MAKNKSSASGVQIQSTPQKGSSRSYAATDHGLAHNYALGQDNPIGGGPGDTPKRQSGRQSPIGKPMSPGDAGTFVGSNGAHLGSHNPGNSGPPGPDRMGSSGD